MLSIVSSFKIKIYIKMKISHFTGTALAVVAVQLRLRLFPILSHIVNAHCTHLSDVSPKPLR